MNLEKPRLSLSIAGDQPASGLSALRLSTRSPSFSRLSLRRSRASSISTASSSESSHGPVSCVARETSRDDCAFNRFMVWVAVRRNACQRMTPAERLECPLLRCRKRFCNHELMLRHLYSCDELESGEYWCYECGKVENFTDAKCKRCLGHPTRRRKMLSMAKTFFTSLGHKSKKDAMLNSPLEDDLLPPPSYDSLAIELCTTSEIHEIDSVEIPTLNPTLRSHPERVSSQGQPSRPRPVPEPSPFLSTVSPRPTPPCIVPAELENSMMMNSAGSESVVMSWINDPAAYIPSDFTNPDRRSIVSLGSHTGDERRMKTRSKTLAPSSSLRSNASSSSTNSTNSTNSTSSTSTTDSAQTMNTEFSISPSEWGNVWPLPSMDADLDSPMPNFLYQAKYESKDLQQPTPFSSPMDDDLVLADVISELPADFPPFSSLPNAPGDLLDPTSLLTFDTCDLDSGMASTLPDLVPGNTDRENSITSSSSATGPSTFDFPRLPHTEPTSLVMSIWETLQAHVSSSKVKLQPLDTNSLALRFSAMDPREVASVGHAALNQILKSESPGSPLNLLCFVHMAYSFFLVIHEEDARAYSKDLFLQALSYAHSFTASSPNEYLEVTRMLWQPDNFETFEFGDLPSLGIQLPITPTRLFSNKSAKGKERMGGSGSQPQKVDSLVEISQHLLDEFEYSILPENAPQILETLASDLWATHCKEASLPSRIGNPAFSVSVSTIVDIMRRKFDHIPGLTSALSTIHNRVTKGQISTVRRAELELLQAANGSIPSMTFMVDYAPFVRRQCDALYSNLSLGATPRSTYYCHATNLIESMITSISPSQRPQDLNDLFNSLTDQFIFDGADTSLQYSLQSEIESPLVNSGTVSTKGISSGLPSPEQQLPEHIMCDEPAQNYAQTNKPAEPELRPEPQKIEADACCEICGYRPKGDPQWFKGSMAKHKKLQHSKAPPRIYKCPYPGCTSQYKNRPDNLRQHQLDKGHFVDGENASRRPNKRKKLE